MMKDEDQKELSLTFRLPPAPDLKQQAVSDYCAYFAYHEQRKDLEAKQLKLRRYVPLRRRIKERRGF